MIARDVISEIINTPHMYATDDVFIKDAKGNMYDIDRIISGPHGEIYIVLDTEAYYEAD